MWPVWKSHSMIEWEQNHQKTSIKNVPIEIGGLIEIEVFDKLVDKLMSNESGIRQLLSSKGVQKIIECFETID